MRWLLQKLLGLDPSVADPNADLGFRLGAPWGALWMVLLVLAGVVVLSAVIYRQEGRPIGLPFRGLLVFLRAAVLAILVLLLCEPILQVEQVELSKPYVVFMVDTSQSMNLHDRFPEEAVRDDKGNVVRRPDVDRARDALPENWKSPEGATRKDLDRAALGKLSRIDFVNAFLKDKDSEPRGSLEKRYKVQFYEFADDLRPIYNREVGAPPLRPEEEVRPGLSQALGSETRLGDCLRRALNDLRGQAVAGVVLFTDGRSNAGDSPGEVAKMAALRGVPLFPVGVGDRKICDIEVRRVEAPERVFANDYVSFTATLVQKGYPGQRIRVRLTQGGKELDSKEVALPEDGKPFQVELRHKPEATGKMDFVVESDRRADELVDDNNSAVHTLNVIEGKIKVLYVEGQDQPRWEYRFLKHAMMRDHTLLVSTLLAQGDGKFFYDGNYPEDRKMEGYPDTQKEIESYDVIVFGDLDPEILTENQMKLTLKFVGEDHRGGFLMIAGQHHAPAKYFPRTAKHPLAPLIPVAVDTADEGYLEMSGRVLTETYKPKVSAAGWQSPILRLENDELANQSLWTKTPEEGGGLPGFFWYFPVPKALPNATVLLRHPTAKARGQQEERPLLVTARYGEGLTMFLGTDEFWRWRFARGDRYFYRFYAQAIQFLASGRGGSSRKSVLLTDRAAYSLGERIAVSAEIKVASGEEYKPYEAESVTMHYEMEGAGEQPAVKLNRVQGSPGRFEGSFTPKGRGKYHAWLPSVALDSAEKRGGECDFEVKLPQLEYEDPRMDEEGLKSLAERGGRGGRFLYLDEARRLGDLITEPEHRTPVPQEFPLWDNWRLFLLFSVVIVVEWVLRKRARML